MRDFSVHPRLRVVALCIGTFCTAARGIGYFDTSRDSKSLAWIDGLIPMQGWAVIWFAAAAFIFVGIWNRNIARWGMSLASSMFMFWGINYFCAWFLIDTFTTRIWLTGSALFALGAFMAIVGALMDSIGPPPGPAIPRGDPLPTGKE